ncbi:MAG: allantoicase [bacterium]
MTRTDNPFHQWIDLAQPRLGSEVVFATDDFFADKSRLIDPKAPVFIPDKYDDHGKWMDGWESRRKRTPGYDFCIVKLGMPGIVHGVNIDTSHFTGNYPPAASIDACHSDAHIPGENTQWQTIVPEVDLQGDSQLFKSISFDKVITHLRLNIFPDGGVARLRVYGEIRKAWQNHPPGTVTDLFALENGGRALACNDEHFGSMHNLNIPGRGVNMGDGWETARRRVPGNDWVILQLGTPGVIQEVEIDTAHFKGNYPDRVSLRGIKLKAGSADDLAAASIQWPLILNEQKLQMDHIHTFTDLLNHTPVSHVRMDIFPDGGISRVRLRGIPSRGNED